MVIDDHLNLMGGNPLVGANDDRFGARFPDMTEVYSARLRAVADRPARPSTSCCRTVFTWDFSAPVMKRPRRSDT